MTRIIRSAILEYLNTHIVSHDFKSSPFSNASNSSIDYPHQSIITLP